MQDEPIHARDETEGDEVDGDEVDGDEVEAAATGGHLGIDSDASGSDAVDGDATGDATGDAAVDEALRTLRGLEARPVHEHVTVIDGVHRALQDRLADEPGDDDSAHDLSHVDASAHDAYGDDDPGGQPSHQRGQG